MKSKKLLIVIALLLVGSIVLSLFYNQERFIGDCIKESDLYSLNIVNMNGSDEHVLSLKDTDTLRITFKTEKGVLRLSVFAPDEAVVFDGKNIEFMEFDLGISENGEYLIVVKGKHAKDNIEIRKDSYN